MTWCSSLIFSVDKLLELLLVRLYLTEKNWKCIFHLKFTKTLLPSRHTHDMYRTNQYYQTRACIWRELQWMAFRVSFVGSFHRKGYFSPMIDFCESSHILRLIRLGNDFNSVKIAPPCTPKNPMTIKEVERVSRHSLRVSGKITYRNSPAVTDVVTELLPGN